MPELCKTFGTIIMDEVHHSPSPTFSSIMDKSYARYKIGLSGTLKRKDGRHVIIQDYFSPKIYIPPKENSMTPTVHMINSGLKFPDSKSMGWADKVTALQESEHYRNLVAALIKKYRSGGHRVLMVSDRVEFLEVVAERTDSAIITGKTKNREVEFAKLAEENSSICGSLSIFKEGLSYNPLSCLILGCPINNDPMLEQLSGRIVRICEGKLPPVIVDIVLEGYTTQNQAANRVTLYKQLGFKIIQQ
jgi:superfamily II DNA or RNA helicase